MRHLPAAGSIALQRAPTMAFLVNDYGKPFASAAVFGNKFADWGDDAVLPEVECDHGRVRNFRAHGLRKPACRRLAHADCSASEIMAVSGHATLAQLQACLDEVENDCMADAAMAKLVAQAGTETATDSYKLSNRQLTSRQAGS
jgi:hypothetical protein